jgi:hypothetical protein
LDQNCDSNSQVEALKAITSWDLITLISYSVLYDEMILLRTPIETHPMILNSYHDMDFLQILSSTYKASYTVKQTPDTIILGFKSQCQLRRSLARILY